MGEKVNILFQANPEYEKFVFLENGKLLIYLIMNKDLYGWFF